jgi:hypothetical protein
MTYADGETPDVDSSDEDEPTNVNSGEDLETSADYWIGIFCVSEHPEQQLYQPSQI